MRVAVFNHEVKGNTITATNNAVTGGLYKTNLER